MSVENYYSKHTIEFKHESYEKFEYFDLLDNHARKQARKGRGIRTRRRPTARHQGLTELKKLSLKDKTLSSQILQSDSWNSWI